jgi:hypothetical protein
MESKSGANCAASNLDDGRGTSASADIQQRANEIKSRYIHAKRPSPGLLQANWIFPPTLRRSPSDELQVNHGEALLVDAQQQQQQRAP